MTRKCRQRTSRAGLRAVLSLAAAAWIFTTVSAGAVGDPAGDFDPYGRVLDIAAGKRHVWFASPRGVLVFTRATGRWRRIAEREGLRLPDVYAVAEDPRDPEAVWYLRRDGYADQIRLGRHSLRGARAVEYPFPRQEPWLGLQDQSWARLRVFPDRVRFTPLALNRAERRAFSFSLRTHRWRAEPFTAEQSEQLHRAEDPLWDGISSVVPSHGTVFLVVGLEGDSVLELPRGASRGKTIRLPRRRPRPGVEASLPFRFQPAGGGLRFLDVLTETRTFSTGIETHRWMLRRWSLDRAAGQFNPAGTRPLTEEQTSRLKEEIGRELASPLRSRWLGTILALERDEDAVWLGGDLGLGRYDLRARRYHRYRRLPGGEGHVPPPGSRHR